MAVLLQSLLGIACLNSIFSPNAISITSEITEHKKNYPMFIHGSYIVILYLETREEIKIRLREEK